MKQYFIVSVRASRYSIYQVLRVTTPDQYRLLAVESFFSDLSKFEFRGLGAPKAVDIPKLISHVVYLNTTKHDPKRGFEFTTSTRDNYPVYLMEYPEDNSDTNEFKNHPFDKYRHIKKKTKK